MFFFQKKSSEYCLVTIKTLCFLLIIQNYKTGVYLSIHALFNKKLLVLSSQPSGIKILDYFIIVIYDKSYINY